MQALLAETLRKLVDFGTRDVVFAGDAWMQQGPSDLTYEIWANDQLELPCLPEIQQPGTCTRRGEGSGYEAVGVDQ